MVNIKRMKVNREKNKIEKIYYNNCSGGIAYEEIDHNKYCLGERDTHTTITDDGSIIEYFRDFTIECSECPKLLSNNLGKIYGGKTGG